MKHKRGAILIIIGIILVVLQLLSFIGNARTGYQISLRFDTLELFIADLVFLISYCFVGIIGVVLMIIGDRIIQKQKSARASKAQNAYYRQPKPDSPVVHQDCSPEGATGPAVCEPPKPEITAKLEPTLSTASLTQSDILAKFNSLDDRGKASVLNVLEHEYTRAYKK